MLFISLFFSYLSMINNKKKGWKQENVIDFKVTKFSDINDVIIPFFTKYPIMGIKSLDFKDWCLVSEMVKKREHKLEKNVSKIMEIQKGMNRGRSL